MRGGEWIVKLKQRIMQHLDASWWLYLFVSFCFIAGLVFGILGAYSLKEQQSTSLIQYIDQGLGQFEQNVDFVLTTSQAVYKNLFNLAKIFVLGLTVLGLPFILLIIFTRGFVLGFTLSFLIKSKGFLGACIALLAIIPPNLLSLPTYILASVSAINFSFYLIRGRDIKRNGPISQYFLGYLIVMAFMALLMICSAFIEGYLSPFFIRLLYSG